MTYSNWGAKVFRNGKRMKNREDVGVYDEDEANLPSGMRIWANLIKLRQKKEEEVEWKRSHHAVLGDGEVCLCAYKNYPKLWVWEDGKSEPERVEMLTDEEWKKVFSMDYFEKSGSVKVNGKRWAWRFHIYGNMADLYLSEPSGVKWQATAGFEYGAGFED